MVIFHCYVSLPEGIPIDLKTIFGPTIDRLLASLQTVKVFSFCRNLKKLGESCLADVVCFPQHEYIEYFDVVSSLIFPFRLVFAWNHGGHVAQMLCRLAVRFHKQKFSCIKVTGRFSCTKVEKPIDSFINPNIMGALPQPKRPHLV